MQVAENIRGEVVRSERREESKKNLSIHIFGNKTPCMMSKTRYLNDISFASDGAAVYRVSWQESTFYQLNDTR